MFRVLSGCIIGFFIGATGMGIMLISYPELDQVIYSARKAYDDTAHPTV